VSAHDRIVPPEGHGEVLCDPPYAEWSGLILANRVSAERWPEGLRALREEARADVLKMADEYSRARGIAALDDGDDTRPIVMTGHQPELYHPGVWVKDFLLDLLASETDAAAVDLVVDTDRASALSLNIPRLGPPVDVQTLTLAPEAEGSFCQAPSPMRAHVPRSALKVQKRFSSCPLLRSHTISRPSVTRSMRLPRWRTIGRIL